MRIIGFFVALIVAIIYHRGFYGDTFVVFSCIWFIVSKWHEIFPKILE